MSKILPTDGFLRSESNPGAIINVDNEALQAYKLRRSREANKQKEINNLKEEITELKNLISQLLEKNK